MPATAYIRHTPLLILLLPRTPPRRSPESNAVTFRYRCCSFTTQAALLSRASAGKALSLHPLHICHNHHYPIPGDFFYINARGNELGTRTLNMYPLRIFNVRWLTEVCVFWLAAMAIEGGVACNKGPPRRKTVVPHNNSTSLLSFIIWALSCALVTCTSRYVFYMMFF